MTYKQLFDTIPFDDLVPFLPKDWQNKSRTKALKIAYDCIRALQAPTDTIKTKSANDSIHISMVDDIDDQYVAVDWCDKYRWENNLLREIAIDAGLEITWAKVAASILFEQTFFGFTPEYSKKEIDFMEEDTEYQLQHGLVATCPPDVKFSDWILENDHFDPIESAKWKAWRSKRRQELGLADDVIVHF